MESLDDVISKKLSKSLLSLLHVVDPDRHFNIDRLLVTTWNALTLQEQRRLYLYLLYKKWRGEAFYSSPCDIISNCHPYPTNWNGRKYINRLFKDKTPLVRAWFDGKPGIYTRDEARVWDMTRVEPLN